MHTAPEGAAINNILKNKDISKVAFADETSLPTIKS
jgi:hypothetical protein